MRLRSLSPHFFGLIVLCLLGWTGYKHVNRPTLGLYWGVSSGLIYQIDSGNPSLSPVKIGDRLLSGNGQEPKLVYALIDQGEVETVFLQIERAGSVYSIEANLIEPSLLLVLSRISFVIIAFCFWLTGMLIYTFGQDRKQALLFLFFCIFTSITLSAGSISSFGPEWSKLLFHFGLVWGGFFAIHLHLDFPSRLNIPHRTPLLICLTSVSSGQTILFVLSSLELIPIEDQLLLWSVSLLIFTFEMLAVIGTVGKSYLRASSADERYRAGIIILVTILGIMPPLLFSVLPEILMGRTLLPYEFSFLSLLFFPLGYGYAILRLKLVSLDSTMDRGAALTFVILILAGFYAIGFSLQTRFLPGVFNRYPFAGMAITVIMAMLSRNLYTRLLFWINRVLYGELYDYRSAINLINDHLKSVETEFEAITTTFCQVVMKSLQLDFVAMISQDHYITLVETGGEPSTTQIPDHNFEAIWRVIARSGASKTFESHSNQALLALVLPNHLMPRIQLVAPIQSQEQFVGLVILGRKRGQGVFEKSDLEILDVAIHQVQISLEKAQLLIDVRQSSYEIRELHRQVTNAREQERKQVSRELHDQVIQSLVSLNYRLSDMRRHTRQLKEGDFLVVQEGLVSVLEEVRQICANLRPPVLDSLDLVSAFRVKINEVQRQSKFEIRLFVHGNKEQDIPEEVRGFAYRLLGESLANISKHANAKSVEVHLSIKATEITIIVEDDGQGFLVPNSLWSLEKAQHFGLASLLEDVKAIKGTLEIDSSFGEGCSLVATIPLPQ